MGGASVRIMDVTATTADLAAATVDVARLLPTRALDPVLSGVLLTASADGITLAGTDRERTVTLHRSALVHTEGAVLVPGRPLADTLRALDTPEIRLVVEGTRLAVRSPRGRFALPLLDVSVHPGIPAAPPLSGRADGRPLLQALHAVAGAASKDEALPLFGGVRIRSAGPDLRLIATDRYRLAIATLPWHGGDIDVLVPATLATEIARQAAGTPQLALHADPSQAVFTWSGTSIGTALLATPFPDEHKYLDTTGDATLELSAAELLAAVRRVGLYADGRGALALDLGDGEIRVRAEGMDLGEADESVKADVHGRLTQHYRTRYLIDALRAFPGMVRIDIRAGMKSTVLTARDDDVSLHYVVMPIVPG